MSRGADPSLHRSDAAPGNVLEPVAVLLGGGIESTALVKQFLAGGRTVVPVHVHCGLIWDDCETGYVRRFLESNAGPALAPLVEIHLPLHDFLRGHWTITGDNVPKAGSSSGDLEIPLRNLTLLSFALHRLRQLRNKTDESLLPRSGEDYIRAATSSAAGMCSLALGTTADNCYRDGSRAYFDKCEEVLSLDAGCPVRVLTPFIHLNKTQVIQSSDLDTLGLSFSCVSPVGELHCGQCIKCGRRQAAFRTAKIHDPTNYDNPPPRFQS